MSAMDDPADLVAWLRAQLDDDERNTRALWNHDGAGTRTFRGTPFDHARVLRAIAAKQAVLDHYERIQRYVDGLEPPADEAYTLAEGAVSRSVQYLATEYADHPGYRESWRP
jgi:hypothetical protein